MTIRTKLDQWCDGIIEAGWLAALIIAPLFFNVYSSRVFEPDKISLVRSIALVMALAWVVKVANGGYAWLPVWNRARASEPESVGVAARRAWRNPFFIPVALLITAYLISTLTSLAPFVSWFGSYQRMQGTYSFLSYVVIGMLTAGHLRSPEQIRRLQHVIVVASVPIAIYGVIQHYDKDPLPWGGDTTARITANAGNAIFLAGYLIMAFFFTVERIFSSFAALARSGDDESNGDLVAALAGGVYIFIAVAQILAIVWTLSRGPWLGLFLGAYLFVLLVLIALRPRLYKMLSAIWVGLGVLGVALLLAMNTLPVFQGLAEVPYLGRLTQVLDQESRTGRVRTLIWEGAAAMTVPHEALVRPDGTSDALNFIRPLVGYGPEAMWVGFNKFYPPDLTQVEARNASPDRSHNETWDSLVITGLLGFLAYMALFFTIFYWALRWLGLLVNRRDTRLFFALLLTSGVAFSIFFYLYDDRQLRLFGVALPAGLMFGLLLYIMAAAFLHPQMRPQPADIPRQLLIITLLTTIVAHFVEIHFGIAIGATRTYFWVLTGVLMAVGLRWAQPQFMAVWQDVDEENDEANHAVVAVAAELPRKSSKSRAQSKQIPRRSNRALDALPWTPLTVLTDVLIFMTTIFLYTTNSRGETGWFTILWSSVTSRVEGGQQINDWSILLLLVLTWITALVLGLAAEVLRQRTLPPIAWWLRAILLHGAITWGAWLVYGLIQAGRVAPIVVPPELSPNEQLNYQLQHIANHFAFFTGLLITWLLVAGAVYALWTLRNTRAVAFVTRPLVSLGAGLVTAAAVFFVITTVNVGMVRADIIYKQGQQFDSQRNWVDSIELYRRALDARETEDYYMLFLGRSLLEQAKVAAPGVGTAGFSTQPTLRDVLNLRPETITQLGRDDLLRAAEAVLLQAQRVNPLNTDHTANLARLYRTWADLSTDNPELQAEMLDKSLAEYDNATMLSPNAAHLWNEKGNAFLARGERPQAEEAYMHSLTLDPYYEQTYLLLADFLDAENRNDEAAILLREGIERIGTLWGEPATVQLNSFLGVALSRSGDITGAIQSMQDMLAADPTNVTAMRNLALLYRDAGDLDTAAQWIEQTLAITPPEDTNIAQLRAAAIDIYAAQALAHPEEYIWLLKQAQLEQQQGDIEMARMLGMQALALVPDGERAVVNEFISTLGDQ